MSAEEFIRYLSSLVGVAGLAVLATTLGSMFGLWAAGLTLFLAGFAIGVPLWKSHFENVAIERATPKTSSIPQEAPKI
jgi:hypothetical protein